MSQGSAVSDSPLTEAEVDLLMRQYVTLRAEISEFVRYYRAHARYTGILLGIIVALTSFVTKSNDGFSIAHSRLFWFWVGIVVATLIAYFAFDALEAQYAMFAVASRAAAIEDRINANAGKALLIWESKLSYRYWWEPKHVDQYWWSRESPLRGVKFPSKYLVFYMVIVIALALFFVPLYSVYAFWLNPSYKVFVCEGRLLTIVNLAYSGISFIFIVLVAPSVLWRMKEPAQRLAREVSSEAEMAFQQEQRAGLPGTSRGYSPL